ncbi:hypothetical protein MKW92_009595 [Papaver armeniacum]|nr:hypothetical protein MKW92_009595 [Papaver armeniacum]
MAQRISSPFIVGFLLIAIVLSSFSETGSAQTFAKTCQNNGGIVKGVKAAENCDVCRGECGKQCPEGYFLLESRFCFTTPCPQPNPVLKMAFVLFEVPILLLSDALAVVLINISRSNSRTHVLHLFHKVISDLICMDRNK